MMARKSPKKGPHKQKGAQQHAQGEHGEKTRARIKEIIQTKPEEPEPMEQRPHRDPAKNRLFSRRGQHDPAEEQSDKTRLSRDIDRHGHVRENFQVLGGAEAHPANPRSHIDPEHPDDPNPG
jgi:hypothetical protein